MNLKATLSPFTYSPLLGSESKLGKGAMDANLTQHQDFLSQYNEWDQLCQDVQAGKSQYDAGSFIASLRKSTDLMIEHLADEIPTMEVRLTLDSMR